MVASPYRIDDGALDRRGRREAGALAGRAFVDDAFFSYLLPDARTRRRSLETMHRSVLAHPGKRARIQTARTTTNEIVALALWLPTGAYPQPMLTQLAQLPNSLRAYYRRPKAISDGYAILQATAKAHPKEPHWYLWLLMTDPALQRTGAGTLLMDDALAAVDQEHVGSSLETQDADNLPYYRRFGYEVRTTLQPIPHGPTMYSMWRAPQ